MARPTKLTPTTIARIVEAIELGATYELAAASAGVAYETFNEWRKTKPQFSEELHAAEGRAAKKWLAKIEAAAEIDWRAMAWKLERRYPKDYGRTIQEHAGETKLRIEYSNDWRNAATHGGDDDGAE